MMKVFQYLQIEGIAVISNKAQGKVRNFKRRIVRRKSKGLSTLDTKLRID